MQSPDLSEMKSILDKIANNKPTDTYSAISRKIDEVVQKMLDIHKDEKTMSYYIPSIKTNKSTEEAAIELINAIKMSLNAKYIHKGVHANISSERLTAIQHNDSVAYGYGKFGEKNMKQRHPCCGHCGGDPTYTYYVISGVTVCIDFLEPLDL